MVEAFLPFAGHPRLGLMVTPTFRSARAIAGVEAPNLAPSWESDHPSRYRPAASSTDSGLSEDSGIRIFTRRNRSRLVTVVRSMPNLAASSVALLPAL